MIERLGSTDEVQVGCYIRSPKGTVYRVQAVDGQSVTLVDKNGVTGPMAMPAEPKPCMFMEPTQEEALAILQRELGAEVVAERESKAEGFRCPPAGRDMAKWHTHMFLMHGIWTKSGPGSRSLPQIVAAHDQDHLDAAEGVPTGAYVKHRH